MAVALDMQSADFDERFAALVAAKRETSADVDLTVADIIDDVRHRGDVALAELSLRFERIEIGRIGLKIGAAEIEAAIGACEKTALEALKLAHARVMDFHLRQKPADLFFTDPLGVELGWRWRPIDAVGLYVPGGAATYPSSVIMNAVPAKVAGCRRLAMVMPTPDGHINPLVLAAARIAGVDEIYRVGGAQAIAALAYGTDTIAPVDKIVGPGNAYVAAAKRRVFGVVGIDMIAGPSEVVVLADRSADPRFVAADLLAQAEHDEAAQSILITDDAGLARAVEAEVERQLESLPRAKIAGASWRDNGAIILCPSLEAALPLVDRLAPEHLEIMADDAEALSDKIANAGAIFLGPHTPEAIGDYVGGSNHVLPTARSARFSSGLGVLDFMKRTSLLKCDARSLEALGPAAIALGRSGGARGARTLGRVAASREQPMSAKPAKSRNRLAEVVLDEATIPRSSADVDHERTVAIFDLIEENSFGVPGRDDGPYVLKISQEESKLTFEVRTAKDETAATIVVSMTPFRPLLKDYFLVCETYYSAIRTSSPRQIEAIDRERTKLHNEGAELMAQRLTGTIDIDQGTARRLFALVSALRWRV